MKFEIFQLYLLKRLLWLFWHICFSIFRLCIECSSNILVDSPASLGIFSMQLRYRYNGIYFIYFSISFNSVRLMWWCMWLVFICSRYTYTRFMNKWCSCLVEINKHILLINKFFSQALPVLCVQIFNQLFTGNSTATMSH